tara:strand:+ start:19359 stop:21257 length:1899 start_codon:yes stop_codon:yes gene_type:complete
MKNLKTYENFNIPDKSSKKEYNKSDLSTEFKNYRHGTILIENFLKKNKLKYELKKIFRDNELGEYIEITIGSDIIIELWKGYMGDADFYDIAYNNENEYYNTEITNLNDIIKFISKYAPEIVTNKVFKKLNEGIFDIFKHDKKIDINKKLQWDFKKNYKLIIDLLKKNNLEYKLSGECEAYVKLSLYNPYNKDQVIEIEIWKPIKRSSQISRPENPIVIHQKHQYTFESEKNIKCLKDVIIFISKNMSDAINTNVFKKLNEDHLNKLDLNDSFNKNFNSRINLMVEFLNKIGVKFNVSSGGKNHFNIRIIYYDQWISIEMSDGKYGNGSREYPYIKVSYRGNDSPTGLYKDEIFLKNFMELIEFISTHIPGLINNKIFKKMNENIFTDLFTNKKISVNSEINYDSVTKFLDKNNIDWKDAKRNDKNYWLININSPELPDRKIQISYRRSLQYEGNRTINRILNKKENTIELLFFPGDVDTYWNEDAKTLSDVIKFISKYAPEIVTNKVFKKINENYLTDNFSKDIEKDTNTIKHFLYKSNIYSKLTKRPRINGNENLGHLNILEIDIDIDDEFKIVMEPVLYSIAYRSKKGREYYHVIESVFFKNMIELIDFISQHAPQLVTNKVFKKINKS